MRITGRFLDPKTTIARTGERPDPGGARYVDEHFRPGYSEVVVATTGPDGDEVEIVGAFLKVDARGKPVVGAFTESMYRWYCDRFGFPLVLLPLSNPPRPDEARPLAFDLGGARFNEIVRQFYDGIFDRAVAPRSEMEKRWQSLSRSGAATGEFSSGNGTG